MGGVARLVFDLDDQHPSFSRAVVYEFFHSGIREKYVTGLQADGVTFAMPLEFRESDDQVLVRIVMQCQSSLGAELGAQQLGGAGLK